jgi:hypothetical protein
MRKTMSVLSALVVIAAVSGCSNSTAPIGISGTWLNVRAPGNSLQMTLTLNGSALSGPGTWCGEALGCGKTTVAGTMTGGQVHLVTTFDTGRIQTFDGTLTSSSSLDGQASDAFPDGQTLGPFDQSFHRFSDPFGGQ